MLDDDIIKKTQDAAIASLTPEQRDAIAIAAEAREMAARARRAASDRPKRRIKGAEEALSQRLDDIAAKIALASAIAADEECLGEQPRLGLYLLLHEQADELREIAELLRKRNES